MPTFSLDPGLDVLGSTKMSVNGLHCTLNMPVALKSEHMGGEEIEHRLPPYAQRPAFNVDEFEHCPESWMRGSATEASFFVPVRAERGLWLDFNANAHHTHHVAAVVSVQGVNAVTGLPTAGAMHLEQYREKCPKHEVPFGADRFCKDCGFKWPDQNYLATTGTPHGLFWLDGFRAKDGRVRQWVFTEEEMRGVASQIIGKDRVFAIGIAFYLSKDPKPLPQIPDRVYRGGKELDCGGVAHAYFAGATLGGSSKGGPSFSKSSAGDGFLGGVVPDDHFDTLEVCGSLDGTLGAPPVGGGPSEHRGLLRSAGATPRPKRLEVAAGARIRQEVSRDPSELSFWQESPAGILYVNYVDEDTAKTILASGKIDRTAGGEGFMSGLNVGQP